MNLLNFKNVLVLAPHTDDGEMGAGGTLVKLRDAGIPVTYIAFSAAEESVPAGFDRDVLRREVLKATEALGIPNEKVEVLNYPVRRLNFHRQEILEDLIKIRQRSTFDLVLLPTTTDIHQDHATVVNEGIRAFKNTTLLGYEFVWNNLSFSAQCFVKLDEYAIGKKVDAMAEYNSQKGRPYASETFIKSLAVTRGVQIGAEYAEAFEVIRLVID